MDKDVSLAPQADGELYQRTMSELAADLVQTIEEAGADSGTLSLVFPHGHELYGYKVSVSVELDRDCHYDDEP